MTVKCILRKESSKESAAAQHKVPSVAIYAAATTAREYGSTQRIPHKVKTKYNTLLVGVLSRHPTIILNYTTTVIPTALLYGSTQDRVYCSSTVAVYGNNAG